MVIPYSEVLQFKVIKIHYALVLSRAFVPAVLLGEAEPKVNEQSPKTQEQPSVRNKCPAFVIGLNVSLKL